MIMLSKIEALHTEILKTRLRYDYYIRKGTWNYQEESYITKPWHILLFFSTLFCLGYISTGSSRLSRLVQFIMMKYIPYVNKVL